MLMKKMLILPLVVSALGASLLASCTSTSQVATPKAPTGMEKEIVSTALLASQANTTLPQGMKMAVSSNASASTSPITFDPNDVSATLMSFDNLLLESYTVDSKTTDSDKSEYAKKDEIAYTLPSGATESIVLYYNEAVTGSVETSLTSASSSEEDAEVEVKLHSTGFRSGAFNDMLEGSAEFDDYETDKNVQIKGSWKEGIAYIESVTYRFYSEELTVKDGEETASFSSFGIFNRSSFLAVEEIGVVDGTKKETAYAYTAFQNATYTRFLLSEDSEDQERRLVYRTPMEKLVINRFVDQGKTLYSLHAKKAGVMNLVGLYEKVITVNDDGTKTVTYALYEKPATIPEED